MPRNRPRRKFYRHKLLLDEGFPIRAYLPRLNERFDVKHIKADLHYTSLSDKRVYEIGAKESRLIVTFNVKHFLELVTSKDSGVIAVSSSLNFDQIEKKILALLNRSGKRTLFGKVTEISGETKL